MPSKIRRVALADAVDVLREHGFDKPERFVSSLSRSLGHLEDDMMFVSALIDRTEYMIDLKDLGPDGESEDDDEDPDDDVHVEFRQAEEKPKVKVSFEGAAAEEPVACADPESELDDHPPPAAAPAGAPIAAPPTDNRQRGCETFKPRETAPAPASPPRAALPAPTKPRPRPRPRPVADLLREARA